LETSFYYNVYIDNYTTFNNYFDKIKDYIETTYGEYGYNIDIIHTFKVRVFNIDWIKNKKIKVTKNTITNTITNNFYNAAPNSRNYTTFIHTNNIIPIIKPKSYQDIFIGMENKFMTIDLLFKSLNNRFFKTFKDDTTNINI
jgi:hypothetical protein